MTITAAKQLGRHCFGFNTKDNGGEAITLTTIIREEEPRKSDRPPNTTCIEQEICLNSYCNGAFIKLSQNIISPDTLRQIANELDKKWIEINAKAMKEALPSDSLLGWHSARLACGITLETKYFDNGDSAHGLPHGVFTNQQILVDQGDIKSGFNLSGASIDANILRKLANELDHFITSTLATWEPCG